MIPTDPKFPTEPAFSSEAQRMLEKLAGEKGVEFEKIKSLAEKSYDQIMKIVDLFYISDEKKRNLEEVLERADELRQEERAKYALAGEVMEVLRLDEVIITEGIDTEVRRNLSDEDLERIGVSREIPRSAQEVYIFIRNMLRANAELIYLWSSYDRVLEADKSRISNAGAIREKLDPIAETIGDFDDATKVLQRALMKFNENVGIDEDWFNQLVSGVKLDPSDGE